MTYTTNIISCQSLIKILFFSFSYFLTPMIDSWLHCLVNWWVVVATLKPCYWRWNHFFPSTVYTKRTKSFFCDIRLWIFSLREQCCNEPINNAYSKKYHLADCWEVYPHHRTPDVVSSSRMGEFWSAPDQRLAEGSLLCLGAAITCGRHVARLTPLRTELSRAAYGTIKRMAG